MIELIDSLGREAVWIGHDWGSPVAWNVALHHPDRVIAVGVYVPCGFSGHPSNLEHGINRDLYPVDESPAGQWDYQLYYYENFDQAQQEMEQDPERVIKLLFRKGDPTGKGQPAATASTRKNGGWFTPLGGVPDMPIDTDVVSSEDVAVYAKHLQENGFFGPTAWYVNGDAIRPLWTARRMCLSMPGVCAYRDYVCDTTTGS